MGEHVNGVSKQVGVHKIGLDRLLNREGAAYRMGEQEERKTQKKISENMKKDLIKKNMETFGE